jgi:hypothetical protein
MAFVNGPTWSDDASMEHVDNVHDRRWVDEDTSGAKGYE